jgi:lysozyme
MTPKPTAKRVGFASVGAAGVLALAYLLHGFESREMTTYWDALGGVYTACGGVTGAGVIPGKTYTVAECDALETAYIARMYQRMARCVPGEMPDSVVKAFGHLSYNIGPDAFCRSTAARLLNEGRFREACHQIPRWRFIGSKDCAIKANKCGGIPRRREWEHKLCLSDL